MTKTLSAVNYNGWITDFISVERGVRQGCPLSASLFIIALELLALKIKSNPDIKGLKLPNEQEAIISQFADDNTLFLKDLLSVEYCLQEVNKFGQFSGLRLNIQKCEALWIGEWRYKREQIAGLKWNLYPHNQIKILGVIFDSCVEASNIDANWDKKIHKMQGIAKAWAKRDF